MTTWEERDIVVFAKVGEEVEVCSLGEEHKVEVVVRKVLGPVVDRREYDNGYEKRATELRQDRQGRTYHQHIQIDFFSNTSWWRDDDQTMFTKRPGTGVVREYGTGRRLS